MTWVSTFVTGKYILQRYHPTHTCRILFNICLTWAGALKVNLLSLSIAMIGRFRFVFYTRSLFLTWGWTSSAIYPAFLSFPRHPHMSNAITSPCRPGRVSLPPRIPAPAAYDQSGGSPGQTSQVPAASPPLIPLTPRNTFDDFYGSDLLGDLDISLAPASDLDFNSHSLGLSELDDQLLDPADFDTGKDDNDQHRHRSSTRSEPLPDTSGSSDNTVIHTPQSRNSRSASVPASPLKSALVAPTPPTKAPEAGRCDKKRAHFNDDAVTAQITLEHAATGPTIIRRFSAPESSDLMGRILLCDSFSEHAQSYFTDESEMPDDEELETAIQLFETVVEELVQVAEEHAEAHEQLAEIAHEVAEAIFRRKKNNSEESSDQDDQQRSDQDDDCDLLEPEESEDSPGLIRQTTADEDVDESCIQNQAILSSYDDDEGLTSSLNWECSASDLCQYNALPPRRKSSLREASLEPIIEETNSSRETVSDPSGAMLELLQKRRDSDPQTSVLNFAKREVVPRRASMADFAKLKGSPKLHPSSAKSGPAACAVTVCSVRAAEPLRVNTVYKHPGARYKMLDGDRAPTKVAQTVHSDSGTFQVLWIEPPPSSSNSDVTILDSTGYPAELTVPDNGVTILRTPSPMDKVKTKLAAWSWAREQGLETEHGGPNWIPLLSCDDRISQSVSTDEPFAPPNTERPSGASSAKHSAPHSPPLEAYDTPGVDEDEEDHPLELKVKASLSRPASILPPSLQKTQRDYLSLPIQKARSTPTSPGASKPVNIISREPSNVSIESAHFKTHKDSLIFLQRRKEEGKMNQQLMNSRDSVILARSKFDSPYPRSVLDLKPAWTRDLSPIPDASPPDVRVQANIKTMEKAMDAPERSGRRAQEKSTDRAHPDEHFGCPICEVERPRWFEANFKKGRQFM